MSFKTYSYRVAVAFDRLVNAILGGRDTETMSSRTYRNSIKGYWYARLFEKFLNLVFKFWDKEHCKESYYAELNRVNVPDISSIDKGNDAA